MMMSSSPLLTRYAQLLRQWNNKINLVSPTTLKELETRHIADCAQLCEDIEKIQNHNQHPTLSIADVGSGAGLPGLVLAILNPQHTFTLIESDSRKAAFLITGVQELGLTNTRVLNQRVEAVQLQPKAHVVTARAFAPLPRLLLQTQHLLAPGGCWLLLKGEAVDAELKGCETLFPVTVERRPSKIAANGREAGVVLTLTPQGA